MRRALLAAIALALMAPASAEAAPGKLISSASDTGDSFVSANAYAFSIENPKRVTYRLTISPAAPGSVEGNVSCDRGVRHVSRDYKRPTSSSEMVKVPLTIRKPDSCYVDLTFSYDDYEQPGSAKLDLFAKYRKRH